MTNKKVEKSEPSTRIATVEELFQSCPKCGGEFLVRVQSKEGLEYWCQDCSHKEFRKWDSKEASKKPVEEAKSEDPVEDEKKN